MRDACRAVVVVVVVNMSLLGLDPRAPKTIQAVPVERSGPMSGTEQPRVGDQERHDEVQGAAHPARRRHMTRSDQRTLVDQRQHEADDKRDPNRSTKIAPL